MNERKTRIIEIDLDAIEQAALNAPRRGPYQFIYGLQDDIEGIRDTEGFMLFDNGLEGSVDTGMLPFFAAVDPDVILVLVALAKEAKKNLDQQDRITFDLTGEKRAEEVCVGEFPEPTLSENAEIENGVFTAGTVRKLWRLKERYRVQLAERDALLRELSNWLVCESIAPPEDMAQSFTPFREAIDALLAQKC